MKTLELLNIKDVSLVAVINEDDDVQEYVTCRGYDKTRTYGEQWELGRYFGKNIKAASEDVYIRANGKKYIWTIGICNSDGEGVQFYRVEGNEDAVKKYLFDLLENDRKNFEDWGDDWDCGTESVEDVSTVTLHKEFYAYAVYQDFHIDYSAILEEEPIILLAEE